MKKLWTLLILILTTRILSFSENISTAINNDSTVLITTTELRYANYIFAEHQQLLTENLLLTQQLDNYKALNTTLVNISETRLQEIGEYRNLTDIQSNQLDALNNSLNKKTKLVKGITIGGCVLSLGLLTLLLVK
jgi:hypothetical protein